MSQENVEILLRATDVFDAGDIDRYLADFIASDIEWRTAAEDPDAGTHRGRDAFRRYIEQWRDSFDDLRAEPEDWIDVDDEHVFAWTHWSGRGRTSGVDADWNLGIVYTIRDGRVVRGEEYFDRTEALKAVGLEQ